MQLTKVRASGRANGATKRTEERSFFHAYSALPVGSSHTLPLIILIIYFNDLFRLRLGTAWLFSNAHSFSNFSRLSSDILTRSKTVSAEQRLKMKYADRISRTRDSAFSARDGRRSCTGRRLGRPRRQSSLREDRATADPDLFSPIASIPDGKEVRLGCRETSRNRYRGCSARAR